MLTSPPTPETVSVSPKSFFLDFMHYYQFNIGDYASHTRHLSPIEDIAYRRLLDTYYLNERPLNSGVAVVARQIGLKDYEAEVHQVLQEFFTLTEDGWINSRADKEISHFKGKIEQASKAGKASADRRSNARSTDVQPTNNQEPITNNQVEEGKRAKALTRPEDVEQQVWTDWVALRKAKKAPVTDTVLKTARKEASLANMTFTAFLEVWCARGSQGLEAAWLADRTSQFSKPAPNTTVPSRPDRDPELIKREQDKKRRALPSIETLAAIAKIKAGVHA